VSESSTVTWFMPSAPTPTPVFQVTVDADHGEVAWYAFTVWFAVPGPKLWSQYRFRSAESIAVPAGIEVSGNEISARSAPVVVVPTCIIGQLEVL